MNSPPPRSIASSDLPSPEGRSDGPGRHTVSWPAILAGLTVALALQILFMLLGAGLGLALCRPLTGEYPIADLGKGAVFIHGISVVLSLWSGGWIAGRFTPGGFRATGGLHGFIVWCAAALTGVLLSSHGAGWALGDLSKLVGDGHTLAGRPAANREGRTTDLARHALKQLDDTLTSFTEEALGRRAADAARDDAVRARREVGMAIARLFHPLQGTNQAGNRAVVAKALVEYTGRSESDADRMIAEWTATHDQLKADLLAAADETEARTQVAADQSAEALAVHSLCAFAGLLLGAIAASCGGSHGARCADRDEAGPEPAAE